jgi:hypothetical protein
MTDKMETRWFQRGIALLLCFVISPCSGFGSDVGKTAAVGMVGRVTALASTARRNGTRVRLKDVLWASDNLATDNSGRVSIELQGGSILSVGSDTQLRIVNHDPSTGETLVNLSTGRLRSRVVKVPTPGKFKVATPHTMITALGTDFFLDVSGPSTQLIVYSGVVLVTSEREAADSASRLVLDVAAGQSVVVDDKGMSHLQLTPDAMAQESIAETIVPEAPMQSIADDEPTARKSSHTARNTLIGGLAVGAIVGAVVGLRGSKSQSPTTSTPTIPATIPPH